MAPLIPISDNFQNRRPSSSCAFSKPLPGSGSISSFKRSFSGGGPGSASGQQEYEADMYEDEWDVIDQQNHPASPPKAQPAKKARLDSLGGDTKPPPSTKQSTSSFQNPSSLNHSFTSAKVTTTTTTHKPKRTFPWDTDASGKGKISSFLVANKTTMSVSVPTTSMEKAKAAPTRFLLSGEQTRILKMVEGGKSVFFTGSAGTGKSVLLREIISAMKRKYKSTPDAIAVTASTGMAACNIGGTTIHSFGGIGLGEGSAKDLTNKVRKNRKASGRWLRAKVLVIDEVSMLDAELFDKLAEIGKAIKKKDKPFGGIQLVVTGDFFQLPPVTRGREPNFAFQANTWKAAIEESIVLTQVFRQKDSRFIDILNEMRYGQLSAASIAEFKGLSRDPQYTDGIVPTELFPMRSEVERANQQRLGALPGPARTYIAEDSGEDMQAAKTYFSNMMAVDKLVLKEGAQVMMIKNMGEANPQLVNGSIGRVVGFADENNAEHLTDVIDHHLHRTRLGVSDDSKLELDDLAWKSKYKEVPGKEWVPVVEWYFPNGKKEVMGMSRMEFKVEEGDHVKARRRQFPLITAWSLSIHKSQGQTLERVKVDLGKVFEKGQAYVALSRATSLEGLQVLRFDAAKVKAHPTVVEWSKTLTSYDKK